MFAMANTLSPTYNCRRKTKQVMTIDAINLRCCIFVYIYLISFVSVSSRDGLIRSETEFKLKRSVEALTF